MQDQFAASVGLPAGDREIICRLEVPAEWTEYFVPRGQLPQVHDDRRRFPRYYYRGWAVLEIDEQLHGVATKDLARGGVGFLHYEQLFPLQEARLWLPGGGQTEIRIARCLRMAPNCFECGATFLRESDREAADRLIALSLRGE